MLSRSPAMDNAIEKSMKEAREYVEKSIISLQVLPNLVEKNALEDLASYVVNRMR